MSTTSATPPADRELVVLCDDSGQPTGTHAKATVHTSDTPLHLAFSCHLTDDDGRVLLTRRALHKAAWPGVWSNAFCGHPAPGEDPADAVVRRAVDELGAVVTDVRPALPDFRYRAVDDSGVVENEVCPVFTARVVGALDPRPDEVCAWHWAHAADVATAARATPFAFSPWMVLQVDRMALYR